MYHIPGSTLLKSYIKSTETKVLGAGDVPQRLSVCLVCARLHDRVRGELRNEQTIGGDEVMALSGHEVSS